MQSNANCRSATTQPSDAQFVFGMLFLWFVLTRISRFFFSLLSNSLHVSQSVCLPFVATITVFSVVISIAQLLRNIHTHTHTHIHPHVGFLSHASDALRLHECCSLFCVQCRNQKPKQKQKNSINFWLFLSMLNSRLCLLAWAKRITNNSPK